MVTNCSYKPGGSAISTKGSLEKTQIDEPDGLPDKDGSTAAHETAYAKTPGGALASEVIVAFAGIARA